MPGDARLVEAVRLLAVQAAGYVNLSPRAGAGLAGLVQRATESAIAASGNHGAPIELHFSGDPQTVNVRVTCHTGLSTFEPGSQSIDGLSINWTTDGSRRTCHIRQRVPA